MAGVVVAGTVAFAAVGRVASGVAPHDVARLSQRTIDDELTAGPTSTSRASARSTSSVPGSSSIATNTTQTWSTTRTTNRTVPTSDSSVVSAPSVTSAPPTTWGATSTTSGSTPPPPAGHNTVTTSQGGTVFTRCSGPDTIVYVAAVPRPGYQRTVDIESALAVRQTFENSSHRSMIEAECSNGSVHAQVEEESADS